jgi:hypothetical protein
VGLQSSQHRSRSAEMTEEGRQRVTSIAPGLLGIVDGTGYANAFPKEMGSRPLTQSVKKSKWDPPSRRLVPLWSLRTKKEVEMEDLTPPDHHGPPSHRRAPCRSRSLFCASAVSCLHEGVTLALLFCRKRRLVRGTQGSRSGRQRTTTQKRGGNCGRILRLGLRPHIHK